MAEMTAGVENLLGNPGKALLSVMWPLMISLFVTQFVNFADSAWCAGLGVNALSAISYMAPIYWMLAGIGLGMGIGLSALVSRAIGEGRGKSAGTYIAQAIVSMGIASLALIMPMMMLIPPLMEFMGGGPILTDCESYAYPIVILSPFVILNGVLIGALRGEGASIRILEMNLITATINVVLDPILIYVCGMGLVGAAIATSLASAVSLIIGLLWYALGKTFVPLSFRNFVFSGSCLKELFRIGGPQIVEYDVMYAFNIILFFQVSAIGGTEGIAIYNTPWRIVHLVIVPLEALGSAIVPVASAAFGQQLPGKARNTYKLATTHSLIMGAIIAILVAAFAEFCLLPFTYSGDVVALRPEMANALRIYCTFIPFFGLCFIGAGVVQSMKKGYVSMISAFIRNFFLIGSYTLATSMTQIYWCTSISEIAGGILAMLLAAYFIRKVCIAGPTGANPA